MRRTTSNFIIGSLAVIALVGFLASVIDAACQSGGCKNDKCYEHNRYCYNYKQTGAIYGVIYDKAVILEIGKEFYCTNGPTKGGTPSLKEEIAYTPYDTCDRDCTTDTESTGAPKNNKKMPDKGTFNTVCNTQPAPTGGEQ
ncbi:MAG: hypothetical protein L0Y72_26085 [Gemmataceae bacterium]|nr:hypothetical protein [Gemmataceae bacterium]